MAGLKQLNWASEGVGATAAALVDLSTVAGNKISNPPWVKFQSAGWVNFPSAPTHSQTRAFIEGGYGYSPRLSDRLREIKNAINRLKRLDDKLRLFSHVGLGKLTLSDRVLRRVLIEGLLSAVSRNRLALDEMIGRLDRLSLAVRKRNKMRQVAHAMDTFLQAGNAIDLEPLLDRPDGAQWAGASAMPLNGHVYCDLQAGESLEELELLIGELPAPKTKPPANEASPARGSRAVPPQASETLEMEKPFARDYLKAMLKQLGETREPQSAVEFWRTHGDPQVSMGIWLYALDGYVQLQVALSKTQGKKLFFRLSPIFEPFSRISANRRVLDLTLEQAKRPN